MLDENSFLPENVRSGEGIDDLLVNLYLSIFFCLDVNRRLLQWEGQCDYDANLLGSWPVAFGRKVERLIHIELRNSRVQVVCDKCGSEHQEWFEVENDKLDEICEVVKRWAHWADAQRKAHEPPPT